MCFRINAGGGGVRPRVRSSTHRVFEKAAISAIRASTFTPLDAGQAESETDVRLSGPVPAVAPAAE